MVSSILASLLLADAKADIAAAEALHAKLSKAAPAPEKRKPNRMFMKLMSGKWVKMAGVESHLDKDKMWRMDVTEVAYQWNVAGVGTLVSFTGGSPSGDWSNVREYSFRPDGTLAMMKLYFSAFSPVEGAGEWKLAFNSKGARILRTGKLTNAEGKPMTTAQRAEVKDLLPEEKVYARVSRLPF